MLVPCWIDDAWIVTPHTYYIDPDELTSSGAGPYVPVFDASGNTVGMAPREQLRTDRRAFVMRRLELLAAVSVETRQLSTLSGRRYRTNLERVLRLALDPTYFP